MLASDGHSFLVSRENLLHPSDFFKIVSAADSLAKVYFIIQRAAYQSLFLSPERNPVLVSEKPWGTAPGAYIEVHSAYIVEYFIYIFCSKIFYS